MTTRTSRGLRWAAAAGLTVVMCAASPAQAASVDNNGTVAPGGTFTISGNCDAPATYVLFAVRLVESGGTSHSYLGVDAGVGAPDYSFSEVVDLDDLDGGPGAPGDHVEVVSGNCYADDGDDPDEDFDVFFEFEDGEFTVIGDDPDPEPEPESDSDPAPAKDETPVRGSSFDTGVELQTANGNSTPTAMTALGGIVAVSGAAVLWTTRRRIRDSS